MTLAHLIMISWLWAQQGNAQPSFEWHADTLQLRGGIILHCDDCPKPDPPDVPAVQKTAKYCAEYESFSFGGVPPCKTFGELKGWECVDQDRSLQVSQNGKKAWCHRPESGK